MVTVKMDVHNSQRRKLFRIEIDPDDRPPFVCPPTAPTDPLDIPHDPSQRVYLNWEQAVDDEGHLRRCPACGCRELFARKDFPQVTGFVIVILAVVAAMTLWGMQELLWGFGVLGAVALIDAMIFFFAGKCLVCYRCRSEYRDTLIHKNHPGWELAIGEKYRPVRQPPVPPPPPVPPVPPPPPSLPNPSPPPTEQEK